MQTIHVSPEFSLNRWIFIVVLAVIFVLPAFAEEKSSGTVLECVFEILSDIGIGPITGMMTGGATIWLTAWLGLKNFRKGMQHNKKAEIYERLLSALFSEMSVFDTIVADMRKVYPLSSKDRQEEQKKLEKAKDEWFAAISIAELYFSQKSVQDLRDSRKEVDKKIREYRSQNGEPEGNILCSLVQTVKEQARKDIGLK